MYFSQIQLALSRYFDSPFPNNVPDPADLSLWESTKIEQLIQALRMAQFNNNVLFLSKLKVTDNSKIEFFVGFPPSVQEFFIIYLYTFKLSSLR